VAVSSTVAASVKQPFRCHFTSAHAPLQSSYRQACYCSGRFCWSNSPALATSDPSVLVASAASMARCKHRRCLLANTLACMYVCSSCAANGDCEGPGPCRHLAAHSAADEQPTQPASFTPWLGDESAETYVVKLHQKSGADTSLMDWLLISFRCIHALLRQCRHCNGRAVPAHARTAACALSSAAWPETWACLLRICMTSALPDACAQMCIHRAITLVAQKMPSARSGSVVKWNCVQRCMRRLH
jgi:hypothetical protein